MVGTAGDVPKGDPGFSPVRRPAKFRAEFGIIPVSMKNSYAVKQNY
jgi:hypothetical protein